MEFDKGRVFAFDDVQALKRHCGDGPYYGWVGNSEYSLKQAVQNEKPEKLKGLYEGANTPYHIEGALFPSSLFYLASHKYMHDFWVKDNDIEPGDIVKIVSGGSGSTWSPLKYSTLDYVTGAEGFIEGIGDEDFLVRLRDTETAYWVTFTMIEKVDCSYEKQQARWVKENNINIGDVVRVTRRWEDEEMGFNYSGKYNPFAGDLIKISKIDDDAIRVVKQFPNSNITRSFPYFVLEKVERPADLYRSAEFPTIQKIKWIREANEDYVAELLFGYTAEVLSTIHPFLKSFTIKDHKGKVVCRGGGSSWQRAKEGCDVAWSTLIETALKQFTKTE